ncbi:hypothetical protein HA402_006948 [Bradysia odoriphaga]|nr:hypothetical protein HA402_006948 [Bradysia odoriphaga]
MNTDERVSDNKSAGESMNGEKEPAGEFLSSGNSSVGDVGSVGGATSSGSGQPEEIETYKTVCSSHALGHDNAQETVYDTMEGSLPTSQESSLGGFAVQLMLANLCSESETVEFVLPPDYLSKVEIQSTKNETSVEHIVAVKSKIGDAVHSTINIGAMVPAENIGISYFSDGERSTADCEATQNSHENIPNASGSSKEDLRNNARFLTVNIAPNVAETISYDDIADGTRSIVDSESTESLFDIHPKSSANASGKMTPVDEVDGFHPSPSYMRHAETFATLRTEITGKNLLVENAEIELNKKKTALAIESLQQSLASIDCISFDQAMKIASEKAGFETEPDQRSCDELRLSRDAAEYEAEEYFRKYMFNEELAFVEQGIRERNAH